MNPKLEARLGYTAVDSPFSTNFIEKTRNFDTSASGALLPEGATVCLLLFGRVNTLPAIAVW